MADGFNLELDKGGPKDVPQLSSGRHNAANCRVYGIQIESRNKAVPHDRAIGCFSTDLR
jgi:hypothetical protein